MNETDPQQATDSVHAGQHPDPTTGARVPPIYQTTSFVFDSADDAANRYALAADGDIYSRISNPTVRTLEKRLAALHGAKNAVAAASGMAALDAATFVLAGSGETIVSSADIYGGTATYFRHAVSRRNIDVEFVETRDLDAFREAVDEKTAYVHLESIGNPSLVTPDFSELASIAHDAGAPLVVDNTFATPALCQPLKHGADLVWESTTKWIHGSGTTIGGVLLDGGAFNWDADRYPEIGGKNPAYHDITFAEAYPEAPVAAAARYRSVRSFGYCQSPFDAWVTLQGVESLPVRIAKHCENAAIVADFLADHPDVAWVAYPGRVDHETHDLANTYLTGGYGGMISFGLVEGYQAGKAVCEAVDLFSFLANIGDAKSLIIHPASTTHGQLSPEEQREAGVTRDLVRLSIGIEDPADIIADLDQAIRTATNA